MRQSVPDKLERVRKRRPGLAFRCRGLENADISMR